MRLWNKHLRKTARKVFTVFGASLVAAAVLGACGPEKASGAQEEEQDKNVAATDWDEERAKVVLGEALAQKGGWRFVYEVAESDASKEVLEDTVSILQKRMKDYVEANVYQDGAGRIVIEIPLISDKEDAKLIEKLIEIKGQSYFIKQKDAKGNLNFEERDGVMRLNKEIEELQRDGSIAWASEDVSEAKVVNSPSSTGKMDYLVEITMTEEGKEKVEAATQEAFQDGAAPIGFYSDGEIIMAPKTQSVIKNGRLVITSINTYEEASRLAAVLGSGEIKVTLNKQESKHYEPVW